LVETRVRAFLFWSSVCVAERHNVIRIDTKRHQQHQNLTYSLPHPSKSI
jgi:hypothetical protein